MGVEKYGLIMRGLRKVAGETHGLEGFYSPEYLELFYDMATGDVWTEYHYSIGHNSWTEYHDPAIVNCGIICEKLSMQEIADMIAYCVEREKEDKSW